MFKSFSSTSILMKIIQISKHKLTIDFLTKIKQFKVDSKAISASFNSNVILV